MTRSDHPSGGAAHLFLSIQEQLEPVAGRRSTPFGDNQ